MRNPVASIILLVALASPLAAQTSVSRPHPDVPAAMDVAGIHLVLSEGAQRLVQQKADGLCRHQPSFQARVDLADASFPIIDRVLKEEGVPLDFRYLALQESALLGNARSNHEAVGYWQLKEETATGLGLSVNDAVDERQHLTSSTRAAARYLTRSNNSLHNWMNALLSYYTGLGGVKPYTLPTDFDATEMAITEATSPYVLMFLAQKVAFEPSCGLNPRPPLLLREFPATPGQTLQAQALTLHTDPAALAKHNYWLLTAAVPADKPYTLIVPVGDVTQAAGILANQRLQSSKELLNAPTVARNTAEVRINKLRALIALPGETMVDLARRAHQRLGEFLRHNEMTGFDKLVVGRPYYLEKKRDAAAVEYHVLQPGETIFDVAQKYGMRQKAVYAKNRMARVEELRPGRVLWLQHTRPRETAIEYRTQPEGVALERPSAADIAAEKETDALVSTANDVVAMRREVATESGQVKVKVKVKGQDGKTKSKRVVEDADGWGETLATAASTASSTPAAAPAPVAAAPLPTQPAPVPAPVRPTPMSAPVRPSSAKVTYLPPPAAAPAPAPLADEPSEADSAAIAPDVSRLEPVFKPAAPIPKPAPTKALEPVATYPAAVAAKPAAAPAPVVAPVAMGKPAGTAPRAIPSDATHRVEARETVYSVSRLYGIAPATLIAINHLEPPYGLVLGQVLSLKAAEPALAPVVPVAKAAPAAKAAPVFKVAQAPAPAPTQTPASHSQHTGRINPATLYVPKKATSAATTSAVTPAAPATSAAAVGTVTQHTVAKGETLYSIARLYNVKVADLQAWNNKAASDASAKIGEVLRVQAPAK
ncbi:LysM peptidoglycan-binding domain-containing protein [Hymenobacter negativus]|uniref:LysM peptidoglycan-binding domain-containing protein n=1 Tax=Hymenobacter negativus TaxID=2795026 RepID=A0ABS3QJD4_9BACT|nr:LysM peptidoglycan-binding domain-containing protein [Hymenobacter negativus]MBO2011370.1 LysM peptidoglycan-binding domain-containing protein [Hymenobacter negativus]